ncbi:MAG TPA: HAMP domain-containing sensor histidine kinase, partial [Armatimonadota bacterium]
MRSKKTTLAALILRHHLWALLLLLSVLLTAVLLLADESAQRMTERNLANTLRTLVADDTETGRVPDTRLSRIARGGAGMLVLDAEGRWWRPAHQPQRAEASRRRSISIPRWQPWALASQVLQTGEMHGRGRVPWTPGSVVWAARVVPTAGAPRILVAWSPVWAIRQGAALVYGAVVLSLLGAGALCVLLTLRIARYATGVIHQVTDSGRRMAAGDFHIHLPAQPVAELDELSTVVTDLAQGLDITMADLAHERQRLARLERLQRQFVADASHELRAPLSAMSMTLAAWEDGLLRPDEQAAAVTRVRREAKRLGHLVAHLLDLSRLESGRELLTPVALDANTVIQDVARQYVSLPGVAVNVELPSTPLRVMADHDGLIRILHNLLENARRFTPDSGDVRLWARREGASVRIGVTDTGCGIAADELPHMWDRFARAAQARATGVAGSGLGLAIVKALVEAMGGAVSAESTP